jgi:hypothetical protein
LRLTGMTGAYTPAGCLSSATPPLAERIERAEAALIAGASEAACRRRPEAGGFVIPIAGGLATFAEDGSPFNKVAGLGFGGVPGRSGAR